MYNSVSGTEADLYWVREHVEAPDRPGQPPWFPGSARLLESREFGRQYVTFTEWQAYPEIRLRLRLKRATTAQASTLEPEP
eukprot:COSAG05_NODE_18451_length_308_cov_0.746411_1_plen_80_part_10